MRGLVAFLLAAISGRILPRLDHKTMRGLLWFRRGQCRLTWRAERVREAAPSGRTGARSYGSYGSRSPLNIGKCFRFNVASS